MSIVGTRPPTLDEWNKYELHHRARLAIKPGIELINALPEELYNITLVAIGKKSNNKATDRILRYKKIRKIIN